MLSSVAVIIAGIIILATGWLYIDPIMSALIGLFILPRTYNLLKESVDILLEAVPKEVDYAAVEKFIAVKPGVLSVHDLHIWTLTSGINALSGHIIMNAETKFSEITELTSAIKEGLVTTFKITHTTIEVHIDKEGYVPNIV